MTVKKLTLPEILWVNPFEWQKILEGFRHIPGPYYDAEGLNGFAFHFSNFRRLGV